MPPHLKFTVAPIRVAKTARLTRYKKRKVAFDPVQALQNRRGLVFVG